MNKEVKVIDPAENTMRSYLVPTGMIAPFTGDKCPAAWEEFADGQGRVLVGANGLGSDNKKLEIGETGGSWKTIVSPANLPDISSQGHFGLLQGLRGGNLAHFQGDAYIMTWNIDPSRQMGDNVATLSFKGGNDPLITAPPFKAVLLCRKR